MHIIEDFLTQSRNSIQTVALHETVTIGEDRRPISRTTQDVAVALVDGVSSRSVFYDPSDESLDIDQFHLSDLHNCEVEREIKDPSETAKLFKLRLSRVLAAGDTEIIQYSVNFRNARCPGDGKHIRAGEEIAGFLRSPSSYVLQVKFQCSARPDHCEQIYQARPTGPIQPVGKLDISDRGSVHLALVTPKPGGHGIAWRWDT